MDGERDPVEELAADYADRLRAGERPAISDYQTSHPELAQAIAELFPTIAALEGVGHRTPSSAAAMPPLPEHLGEFRILRELGRGGMGIIYLAEQPSLGRKVAIKVLPPSAVLDAKARARFQREARLAANLAHPGIVPIHAVGEQDGVPWFAMHLVQGVGLDRVIGALAAGAAADPDGRGLAGLARRLHAGDTPLPAGPPLRRPAFYREVALLVAQAAEALHHAHRQGILHRDIKPANLLLDGDGRMWVGDFGLAKAIEDAGLTGSNDVVGTLRYLAPERFDGRTDEASDIYGLGLVLFELATGQPAFASESRSRLINAIINEGVPAPRLRVPTLPADLERIVLRACARRPVDRHPDAGVLAVDLRAFAGDGPLSAATRQVDPTRWRRRPRLMLALALAGLGALALLAAWLVRPPAAERQPWGGAPQEASPEGRDPNDPRPPSGPRPWPPPGAPRPPPGTLPPPGTRPPADPLHLGPPR